MTANDVMDFPEPDSPTRPRTSRGAMENDRSRTANGPRNAAGVITSGALWTLLFLMAWTALAWAGNSTLKFRTSSSAATSLW